MLLKPVSSNVSELQNTLTQQQVFLMYVYL
jgi:hypothetical protein